MTTLLDHLYEDTRKKVAAVVNFSNPDSIITMSMDGWQAPTGEHIRNYMWVCDNATFFFNATNAGIVRPTSANIAAETIKMIEATGPANVAGLANDNAAAETGSWDAIRAAYSWILCTGCTTHAGALLFKDVCKHSWAKALIEKAVKVAKFIKHHQFTNADLRVRTKQTHGKEYCIILHGETRFAGVYYVIKRLLLLRPILREMVASGPFEERNIDGATEIITIINNTTFWRDLQKLRLFLKPLKCFIKLMDHDCHCTHHEYPGEYHITS